MDSGWIYVCLTVARNFVSRRHQSAKVLRCADGHFVPHSLVVSWKLNVGHRLYGIRILFLIRSTEFLIIVIVYFLRFFGY